jgi:hypothetical protein
MAVHTLCERPSNLVLMSPKSTNSCFSSDVAGGRATDPELVSYSPKHALFLWQHVVQRMVLEIMLVVRVRQRTA